MIDNRIKEDEKALRLVHDCSINNKVQQEQSKLCGCFCCCEVELACAFSTD